MEGLKAIILSFVGSVISLPEGITCFPTHTEAITPLTCCMEKLPGIWQVPIWQDIPIWLSAPVSCMAEQQATTVYSSVHWVLVIKQLLFSFSEVRLPREDQPEPSGESLVILDKTDRKRSIPEWLWLQSQPWTLRPTSIPLGNRPGQRPWMSAGRLCAQYRLRAAGQTELVTFLWSLAC